MGGLAKVLQCKTFSNSSAIAQTNFGFPVSARLNFESDSAQFRYKSIYGKSFWRCFEGLAIMSKQRKPQPIYSLTLCTQPLDIALAKYLTPA